jgi:hypothetical protein
MNLSHDPIPDELVVGAIRTIAPTVMPYIPVVPSLAGWGGVDPRELCWPRIFPRFLLPPPVSIDITNLYQRTYISRLRMTVKG